MRLAKQAFHTHKRNANLLHRYLGLMQDQLDEKIVRGLYNEFVETCPKDANAKVSYGRWLHSRGHLGEAEEVLKPLAAQISPSFVALYGYGRLLLDMRRYVDAQDQFKRILDKHKGHLMARDGLAQALRGQGDQAAKEGKAAEAERLFAEAENEWRHAIWWANVREESIVIFYRHLGWFCIDRGRYTEARNAFESAIDDDPDHFEGYWGRGCALIGMEQFQAAASALHAALEKAPQGLGPPASEEIPELLRQCRAGLEV